MSNLLSSLSGLISGIFNPKGTDDSSQPKAAADASPTPDQDDYVKNANDTIAHFYDSAKWILGVFAAVAVLLLAGTQLSSIGRLPVNRRLDDNRFWVALVAVIVGITSAGAVILFAVRVLQSGRASIEKLKRQEQRSRTRRYLWRRQLPDLKVVRDSGILADYDQSKPVASFIDDYQTTRNNYKTAQGNVSVLALSLKEFEQAQLRLLATVKAEQVRRTFRHSLIVMFVFGTIASVSIVAFAWAANPPSISASAIFYPERATVTLTSAEQQTLAARIGASCVGPTIDVIMLGQGASSDQYDVVTIPKQGCEVARFTAGSGGIGTLQPSS